jgi:hypothetical chaperone protein
MTEQPIAYGIDFGTSNSLISVARPNSVEVVDLGSRRVPQNLPSAIYLNADGNRAAGDQAIEQYLVSAGVRSRLLVGIKSDLSDSWLKGTSSWGMSWTLSDLVEVIMRSLKRAADAHVGNGVDRVVLGHPVAFIGSEGPDYERLQGLAMERLLQAARQAGFSEIETLEEPAAAIQEEELPSGLVVALDFGGGTFDVAVVDYRPDEAEVIALRGAAIGGERFDQLLFNAKVATELGLHDQYTASDGTTHRLPNRVRANSRALLDLQGLLSDPTLRDILQRFRTYANGENLVMFERLLYEGFAYHFYEAIEESKIRLSSESETSISFHRSGLDVEIPITRAEFDALIEHDIGLLQETIVAALADAGIEAGAVDRVVQTGGSSAIPLFADMVRSVFPDSDLQQRPPFTTVVEGLGYYAQGIWQ